MDINHYEDDEWAQRISPEIAVQERIDRVLYHYDYIEKPQSWWQL